MSRTSIAISLENTTVDAGSSSNTPAPVIRMSVRELLNQNFAISEADDPSKLVAFPMSEYSMKGVSRNVSVKLEDIPGFVSTLRSIWENREEVLSSDDTGSGSGSAVDTLIATVRKNDEGRVYFRTSSGKGMKPTSLREGDLPVLVNFLKSRQAGVMNGIEAYKKQQGK
jgi:hypothetical protein